VFIVKHLFGIKSDKKNTKNILKDLFVYILCQNEFTLFCKKIKFKSIIQESNSSKFIISLPRNHFHFIYFCGLRFTAYGCFIYHLHLSKKSNIKPKCKTMDCARHQHCILQRNVNSNGKRSITNISQKRYFEKKIHKKPSLTSLNKL